MREQKITFDDIYKDFKLRLPNLSKEVSYWKPNGYLTIDIYFKDGSQMLYDYFQKKGVFVVAPGAIAQFR